jgi:radical SAM superfamily enzyme YgiQ (UPF0313 family)
MKILICNPPWLKGERTGIRSGSRWPFTIEKKKESVREKYMPFPFNLAYAAAVLEKNGFEVNVIDAIAMEYSENQFLNKVKKINPDLIFMESFTPSFENDLYYAKRLKEITHAIIVFGGQHVTALPNEVLKFPFIDFGVIAEYDYTLLELVEKLSKGKKLKNIAGLAYKDKGEIIVNKRRPLVDVNGLPFPARHLFPMDRYNENFCDYFPNIQILTSRGCPFRCIFCLEPWVWYGPSYRARNVDLVIKEIEEVVERYKPKEIYFDDSTFTVDNERTIKLSNAIKNSGIDLPWSCMTAANTVLKKEMLVRMYESGCYKMKLGLESASSEILKNVGKPFRVEDLERVLRWCKEIGIRVHLTSMFGLPGETVSTIKKTLEYLRKVAEKGLAESLQFSIATPFPGTKFYEMAKQNGWLISSKWSDFDGTCKAVISYPNLSAEEIEKYYRMAPEIWRKAGYKNLSLIWKKLKRSLERGGVIKTILTGIKRVQELF